MEEKAWEHFMTSGSVLDYLEYREALNKDEQVLEYSLYNSREKEVHGRTDSDWHGIGSYAGRGL